MGGKGARREAQAAAETSRREAEALRQQTVLAQTRADEAAKRAQRLLMRNLRARGGGLFETDFMADAGSTLGGGGVLG